MRYAASLKKRIRVLHAVDCILCSHISAFLNKNELSVYSFIEISIYIWKVCIKFWFAICSSDTIKTEFWLNVYFFFSPFEKSVISKHDWTVRKWKEHRKSKISGNLRVFDSLIFSLQIDIFLFNHIRLN